MLISYSDRTVGKFGNVTMGHLGTRLIKCCKTKKQQTQNSATKVSQKILCELIKFKTQNQLE